MRRILYCVFFGSEQAPPRGLRGVDARPVRLLGHGRLCAAASTVLESPLVPTLERIRAYERVVEALFADRTVVPMRFGSILESKEQIARFLEERGPVFEAQLRELEGCVEMGIRVLSTAPGKPRSEAQPATRSNAEPGSGRAYLEALASRRPPEEGPVDRFRRAFRGLFKRVEIELPIPLRLTVGAGGKVQLAAEGAGEILPPEASPRGALSLAFLVPRDRVEEFRAAFERMGPDAAGSRLSGPWPPYSFVTR
jgi:hypothetical protein